MADAPILSVRGLRIRGPASRGRPVLVAGLDIDIGVERLALVGESGSGKSLTARALAGLLPAGLTAEADSWRFGGRDMIGLPEREWRCLRGAGINLVLQDPRHALNPVIPVQRQLEEILRLHGEASSARRRSRIADMLRDVGIADAPRVLRSYPHELSGGIGQRVMLAMMLVNGPRLLIADEPTSALDSALRERAMDLLTDLVTQRRMGLLLISHDLHQVARICDRVLVLFRGRLVEELPAGQLGDSSHAYTRALWSCRPSGASYGSELPVLDPAREAP